MSLLDTLTDAGKKQVKQKKKPSNKAWEKGKKFSYMASSKKDVLEKYPKVFQEIQISEVKGAPILNSRAEVVKKIEEIYNDQFQRLLKQKSLRGLDLPRCVYNYFKKNFKTSRNYFVQALANFMYSCDKYGDHEEVSQFLKFVQGPQKDLQLVYYIYLRQNFKILTYNSFFNHKKTAMNPLLIDISYTKSMEILEQAFYYDELVMNDLKKHIRTKVQPKKRIKYYDFLLGLLEPDVGYRDLELMNYLIALYNIKNPDLLMDEATLTKMMLGEGDEYDDDEEEDELEGIDEMPEDGDLDAELDRGATFGATGGSTGLKGTLGKKKKKKNKNNADGGANWLNDAGEDMDGGVSEKKMVGGHGVAGFEDDSLYLEDGRVIAKYKNKIKAEEVELQKDVKNVLKKVVQEYINKFKKNNKCEEMNRIREKQIYDRVYKKIFNLTALIFYGDRKNYFDILRVPGTNKKAGDLWSNMSKQYVYLKGLDSFSFQVAKDFLNTWLESPLINKNIEFFLHYEYGCPNKLIEQAYDISVVVLKE